jgi:hypothetical protein
MGYLSEKIKSELEACNDLKIGTLYDQGLINPASARNWLIRKKYFEMARTGRSYTDIKIELSLEYDVSVSMIEKIIYRPNNYGKQRST